MSDNILDIAKFDAGIQTENGYEQFSMVNTIGNLIGNREYKEGFDKFKNDNNNSDTYIWKTLSAISDQTGNILYENIKNYIDYVTNIDICKILSLRSMIKIYGLNYKIFDNLDMLPIEILDLINIFSINKKYILLKNILLDKYKDYLSSENISAIYNYENDDESTTISANIINTVIDYTYPIGGNYYNFVVNSFASVLNNFLNLSYEENGIPIYKLKNEDGIYNDLILRRSKYTLVYQKDTKDYEHRRYKILHGISLLFNECAALDRIEKGIDSESMYSGAKAELILMEKEWRLKSFNNNKTSRYAYYKKLQVLEYANFIINKYFSDHRSENLSSYSYNKDYFIFEFEKGSGDNIESIYANTGKLLIINGHNGYVLNENMINDVAKSLADTTFYISNIREKIKLLTRKNYMKGTYDLMLYVINEFLVDYSRTNSLFRNDNIINLPNRDVTVSELLRPIYVGLSSHDINNLATIEYFDETEYFNIATDTDNKSDIFGTNNRFWQNPNGESLIKQDGLDSDFDINSITSFYMDTLGIRDNYISDENTLCAFLDAVFNLGAMDSFIHKVNDISSSTELFGTQIEKYGKYSDDLYNNYLKLKLSWLIFTSYLSNEKYEYLISDNVSAQALSVAEYIKLIIYNREFASVSAVYNKYIEKVDELSSQVNNNINAYNNLLSGEYSFYFNRADGYKYCFDNDTYKHEYYIGKLDDGLEYLYDKLYKIGDYAKGSDDSGNYITNWPIHDTVKYFYNSFIDLSSKYISMITGQQVLDIGLDISHNWSTEYGFVDISAVSLENEFKHGYDFINENIKARKQFILDKLNNLKSLSIDLSNKNQNIKNSLTLAIAQFQVNNPELRLTDESIYAFSLNKAKGDYMEDSRCQRSSDLNSKGYSWKFEKVIAGKTYYYYDNEKGTGEWAYDITPIPGYDESDSILARCRAIKKFMEAPTSFYILTQDDSYYNLYNYELMDEGIFAAITQVESDFISLLNSINSLVNEINNAGFELELSNSTDIDTSIDEIIAFLNSQVDENIVEKDSKISDYKLYLSAILKLSAMYLPIKYEYDSIFKDLKQAVYLSEFLFDNEMTLIALSRLSAYNIDKDSNNKNTIILTIDLLKLTYLDIILLYLDLAKNLSKEYMLPLEFLPYDGYIEEMLELMYDALKTDVNDKTIVANNIALNEFNKKLKPAAETLISCLSPYENYLLSLPTIVNKKLKELYYFDRPNYLKQKEIFLTYGGRSFCYYPYFNLKNTVHSSYQVHPFLWNFIKRDLVYGAVSKTFFSVNIDELEKENIALNWHKFYGKYGETKYNDLSKQRYPDYSGYQSRYEDSIHIAENTLFVSEVVDYDGAFYPPAIEWIRTNGLDKAIASIRDLKYNLKIISDICSKIYELSSLEWEKILDNLIWINNYKSDSSVSTLTSNVLNKFYNKNDLDFTKYDLCNFIKLELSSDDTFYGRFYRQLRLDQNFLLKNKQYIIDQLQEYWENHSGDGPSICNITENCSIDCVHDIYKYGIDSYGNIYCLYKQYDLNIYRSSISQGGLSYKYKQSTPGELWIRLKNHPIAFPAFSGSHPNIYIKSKNKRHAAFVNLFDLYKKDSSGNLLLDNDEPILLIDEEVKNIKVSNTSCIYDFEFTKDKNDITFITLMYNNELTCRSRDIQNYQNSWLVHCRPIYDVLTSDTEEYNMSIFRLYAPDGEVDYFLSGDSYDKISLLSALSVLNDDGCTLYQYIGSYLKGNTNIYHTYVKKHIYKDSFDNIIKEAYDLIKIFPVINGKYSSNNNITGNLIKNNKLSIVGPDVCVAYDETNNIINFAALTLLSANTTIYTDNSELYLSSNADGPIINDPVNSDMNSHDIFNTNITLFKKLVISKLLQDIYNINDLAYTFNTNADMSYFPVYPGLNNAKKLYQKSEYYDSYSVELLGTSKDISQQISFVNTKPDPYFDMDNILSNFANSRVYQDYIGYIDETLKIINNKLIGSNSKVLANSWKDKINVLQTVIKKDTYFIWQLGLNSIYLNFNLDNIKKLKILFFNKKCYGKNPYLFADLITLKDNWINLLYNSEERPILEQSVISAEDYIFGYNNLIIVLSTLDGMGTSTLNDSNHIYNIKSISARLIINEDLNYATLEFKFDLINPAMINYTFIPELSIQAVLLDIKNLEIFNYFHYLDTYGVLRVIDYFKTMEELNEHRIKHCNSGWTLYYSGYEFSEEDLMCKLKSYYDYKNKMIPLSSVDLSLYNCLSDVYILQGSRKLAFKLDEGFRYELSHPGYFYPTINTKFPLNPALYMMQYTSFKEGVKSEFQQLNIFENNNLFILDTENPYAILSSIGKIDIPIILNDTEYIFAYEEYLDFAGEDFDNRRNCDLYDIVDPYVLLFIQFEADTLDLSYGIPKLIANSNILFDIPDTIISNVSLEEAIINIGSYLRSNNNIHGIYPSFSELFHNKYILEYVGFTLDNNSLTELQMIDLLRIYVNYRKYSIDGKEKIELYFNYMNYLNSPYLKILDNKVYIDIINNTYLSLKLDEDGFLDIIALFKYYNGKTFYGYKNVKLITYQIYNISDDKPKFIIKKIDTIIKDKESNKNILPISQISICDVNIDTTIITNKNKLYLFDIVFAVDTNIPLKYIEFYFDYPIDFIEFIGINNNIVSGEDWNLHLELPGYAKVIMSPSSRFISIPVKTKYTVNELIDLHNQSIVFYVNNSIIIGQNDILALVKNGFGKVNILVEQITSRLNVLLTDKDDINKLICVFNTEYSTAPVKAYILSKI